MKKTFCIFGTFLLFLLFPLYTIAQPQAPPNIPRIKAEEIKFLIKKQNIKYIFIDAGAYTIGHLCGAVFINYSWCGPPYGPKEKIKNIKIPKDYYIFVYCT